MTIYKEITDEHGDTFKVIRLSKEKTFHANFFPLYSECNNPECCVQKNYIVIYAYNKGSLIYIYDDGYCETDQHVEISRFVYENFHLMKHIDREYLFSYFLDKKYEIEKSEGLVIIQNLMQRYLLRESLKIKPKKQTIKRKM